MKSIKILAFLTVLLLFSCKSEPQEDTANRNENSGGIAISKEQFDHNEMELGKLTVQNFPDVIRVNGKIDVPPENRAIINVFEGGYVKRSPLLEGSKVKQGQLILSLENPRYVELQQEYLELAGQLAYLRSETERQEIMFGEKITSEKNFLRAQSEYKTGLARYNALRKRLQMLNIDPQKVEAGKVTSEINIYTPISGTVDRVNVSRGMFVEHNYNIMEIVNTDHLHLELNAFEKDLMRIREGQKVHFTMPQYPATNYEAEVWLVGKIIDEDRRAGVHAHLADSLKEKFAVGMFVEAQIITKNKDLPALPEEAIVEVDNAFYVLVLDQNSGENYIFNRREVKPAETFKGYTTLEDPEALTGKQVLTRGAFNLLGN
ncbi:efflux RND transporter periplasmic adaptor subunit [Salinimicrobium sp. CDJ15-81-2]|nr:efflux RND transporter periplasmic adaptor subunit [Salinimicrobium nanhaiense]